MQVINCQQGDDVWKVSRCGVITASMFGEVRRRVNGLNEQQHQYVEAVRGGASQAQAAASAGYKKPPTASVVERALAGETVGDYTNAARDYAFRLALERISWQPLGEEGFETWAMKRGHELEPEARAAHSAKIGKSVERVGIVLSDDGRFGASADGFIGAEGGAEYKCLVSPERLRGIILDQDLSEFTDQVQGCMWLSGRSWWHFGLYCPALKLIGKELIIHELQCDEDYIASLERDLIEFDQLVMQYKAGIERSEVVWACGKPDVVEPELTAVGIF